MKRLTKRKALEICRELWVWLADHPEKWKNEWPGWEKYGKMKAYCPCCEYNEQHGYHYCNAACLIKWPGGICLNDFSPYRQWAGAISPAIRTKYARKIVKLCDEALARLPKRKKK